MSKKITLLGSTGSIGTQSLDVIRAQGYEVFGLSAHSTWIKFSNRWRNSTPSTSA